VLTPPSRRIIEGVVDDNVNQSNRLVLTVVVAEDGGVVMVGVTTAFFCCVKDFFQILEVDPNV